MNFDKTFEIEHFTPGEFCGANNSYIDLIQKQYPRLRIIARDNFIKVSGEESDMEAFENTFNTMMQCLNDNNLLTTDDVLRILDGSFFASNNKGNGSDVLVQGRNGMVIKARTPNQQKMVEALTDNDMLFAIGPAGTGKTYTAVALAVKALKNKEVRKIILTRPAVEAGENLGFLPGDLKEKLDPYLQPLYDALYDMIPAAKLASFLEDRTIEIAPLAFMRGRTLDFAFVILDEAQNATQAQLKMFLTRMGKSAKFCITGDITQVDLPKNQPSGLIKANDLLKNIQGIAFVHLNEKDVVRHRLVTRIIEAYKKHEQQS